MPYVSPPADTTSLVVSHFRRGGPRRRADLRGEVVAQRVPHPPPLHKESGCKKCPADSCVHTPASSGVGLRCKRTGPVRSTSWGTLLVRVGADLEHPLSRHRVNERWRGGRAAFARRFASSPDGVSARCPTAFPEPTEFRTSPSTCATTGASSGAASYSSSPSSA